MRRMVSYWLRWQLESGLIYHFDGIALGWISRKGTSAELESSLGISRASQIVVLRRMRQLIIRRELQGRDGRVVARRSSGHLNMSGTR